MKRLTPTSGSVFRFQSGGSRRTFSRVSLEPFSVSAWSLILGVGVWFARDLSPGGGGLASVLACRCSGKLAACAAATVFRRSVENARRRNTGTVFIGPRFWPDLWTHARVQRSAWGCRRLARSSLWRCCGRCSRRPRSPAGRSQAGWPSVGIFGSSAVLASERVFGHSEHTKSAPLIAVQPLFPPANEFAPKISSIGRLQIEISASRPRAVFHLPSALFRVFCVSVWISVSPRP